jgi:hypothetical protein
MPRECTDLVDRYAGSDRRLAVIEFDATSKHCTHHRYHVLFLEGPVQHPVTHAT